MSVRLLLFGAPKIEHEGASLVLPLERRSQLLVLLALRRAWVGRAELAALLWPELEKKLAYSNLRKTLFRLQAVPWGGHIESQGGAVRFEAQTDVFAFESALQENRLADAVALYRGELLAGFDDGQSDAWSSWLSFERERLRVTWRAAALALLGTEIDAAAAVDLAARLLEADPLDEAALRACMIWLAHSGQSGRARQVYRDFAARLAQDLGLAPSAQLQALHDELAGTAATAARQAAVSVPTTPPADGFVGRAIERRRITALLAQNECRLLCITGPGGMGKTRLARRAATELAANFADGTAFVALDDVMSPHEVGSRLARDLGIDLHGSAEPLDQAIEFLRERQMLLVLDNYEQLASSASILQRLLQACPRVKLVVTSRVRLGIEEEWLLPLAGLPCPEMEDADRIEAFDAVRLFFNAARRVDPTLELSAHAAPIIDICRQLEGLPLALELAAAWTRLLSCAAIADELRHGTELLHAVDGAHPARHASIDVVFEHSWRLLTPIEREALARLSVFRGGFTAAAARAVAGASLPILAALADKSLVRKDETRLFLHPLVQQLAAARLTGEARAAAEAAHAQYFHGLLAQLEHAVERGDRAALEQVEAEFENGRAAWRWAIARDTGALAQSLSTVLQFCDHRSRFEEGLSLLSEALDAKASRTDATLQARVSAAVAHLQYRLDRYADAAATATQGLGRARAARSHPALAQCFQVLGACALRRGQLAEAKRMFVQSRRHAVAGGDLRKAAGMLDNQALVEKQLGRYDEALRLSLESLAQQRRLGDVAGEALCLTNIGALQLDRGQYAEAAVHFKTGLALAEAHGLVRTRGLILANLTELAVKTHDDAAANTYAGRALEIAQSAGHRDLIAWLQLQLAGLAVRRGDLVAARSDLAAALQTAAAIGRPALQLAGIACFAEILRAQGEAQSARRVLAFAADHVAASPQQREELRMQLAQYGESGISRPSWPNLELSDLVHRLIAESEVAHAPLLAVLRRP